MLITTLIEKKINNDIKDLGVEVPVVPELPSKSVDKVPAKRKRSLDFAGECEGKFECMQFML